MKGTSRSIAVVIVAPTDPRGVVAEVTGSSVPQSVSIEVTEETLERAYLVIP